MQPVVGEILDADGETFAEPFKRLADRTPPPANVAERRDLKARFVEFTQKIGTDFHAWFHHKAPLTCGFRPVESTASIWVDADADPRHLLRMWAATYADEFRRHHPFPTAWKAARLLRERCAQPADIQGIARTVGASRSALNDSFWRTFGTKPSAYHARVRLTHGLTALRNRGTKVEDAARRAGFASVKNFNRAVRHHTAMMPSEVRRLPSVQFEGLLRSTLQTDLAVLAQRVGRRAPSAERRAPSAERRAPSAEKGLSSTNPLSMVRPVGSAATETGAREFPGGFCSSATGSRSST